MQFNPSSNLHLSIVNRMDRACGTDVTRYPLVDKAADANLALDRFWVLAMTADGSWQIDDSNNTTLPIATTNLMTGQQDIKLRTDMMEIEKVLVKDNTGVWRELFPTDIQQSRKLRAAKNIIELPTNNVGAPRFYDKNGLSLFLDPIPNYNSTAGVKVFFKRGPNYFISTDTTKEPGIPVVFHDFIWRFGSLQFLMDKSLQTKINNMEAKIQADEAAITEFYSNRASDEPLAITMKRRSSR